MWKGKIEEISGAEPDTTNLRMELTAACAALETIDEGHVVTVYSDSSYLVNCMRRGWYRKWRENGWLNHRNEPVANRDLWEDRKSTRLNSSHANISYAVFC